MIKGLTTTVDKVAIALFIALSIIVIVLVGVGDQWFESHPKVQRFSWQGESVSATDLAFILTFNRPMDHASVEENLSIEPSLPGRISWAGRRMAYTLDSPASYGEAYSVSLEGAREQFFNANETGAEIEPFQGLFSTPDRAFTYIGVEGEETGRLIIYNFTKQEKRILTPPDLVVTRIQPYRETEKILFAAIDKQNWRKGLTEEKLYSIPTGLNGSENSGLDLVLDNQEYRNLNFDLSQDGNYIIVQRINRQDPSDFGLWIVEPNQDPQRIETAAGGQFLITPDSQTLAIAQGEGIAIVPLDKPSESTDALDFLAQYGQVLSFSRDGTAAAMINFNTDNPDLLYTRSLYLVTNQDVEKKLLDTDGSILECQFNPNATILYCLITDLTDSSTEYIETPYLTAIDLKTDEVIKLARFTEQIDIQMSLAPDGVALLFDQVVRDPNSDNPNVMRTNAGEAVVTSKMWLLPVSTTSAQTPQENQLIELPLPGFRPHWLP